MTSFLKAQQYFKIKNVKHVHSLDGVSLTGKLYSIMLSTHKVIFKVLKHLFLIIKLA